MLFRALYTLWALACRAIPFNLCGVAMQCFSMILLYAALPLLSGGGYLAGRVHQGGVAIAVYMDLGVAFQLIASSCRGALLHLAPHAPRRNPLCRSGETALRAARRWRGGKAGVAGLGAGIPRWSRRHRRWIGG